MTQKTVYILHHPHIIGPFTPQKVLALLQNHTVQLSDPASLDKQHWTTLTALLELPASDSAAIPAGTAITISPDANATAHTIPAETATTGRNTPNLSSAGTPGNSGNGVAFWPLLSHAVSAPVNGSDFLRKAYLSGSKNMLLSGVITMFTGWLVGFAGCILFAPYYPEPASIIFFRTLIWLLLAGGGSWLLSWLIRIFVSQPSLQVCPEADFLCAMGCMLDTAWLTVILNGSLFIWLNDQFACTLPQQIALGIAAVFTASVILTNSLQMFRMNFMGNTQLQPGTATSCGLIALWITVLLPMAVSLNMYFKIF